MPYLKNFIKVLLFGLICLPAASFANFDFNANCLKAYQSIFELKLTNARQLLAAEKRANPQNAIVPLLENYIDYFHLLTTESKTEFDKLEKNKNIRLSQISDDDNKSPYYLYAQAEINLQWALIRGRYGEFLSAGLEIKKAFNQFNENNKKFPAFHLNLKGIGLINTVLGSLPDGFLKTTLSTFGLKGNVQTGLAMLDKLIDNLPKSSYEPFYEETVFYYVYVLSDVLHSPSAYAKTAKLTARISDSSLLKTYLQAYVYSRNAHTDEALSILASRPSGAAYQPIPYLDYLTGVCRLNKLDYSAAAYFEKFLRTNKGVNYIKDAHLRLAWIGALKSDSDARQMNLSKVKSTGYNFHEKDKQAVNEANAPLADLTLLKARLLFDGGYYGKAEEMIQTLKPEELNTPKDKTEYYYRFGRISSALNKDDAAIAYFQSSIFVGKTLKYYFAANAALQIGKIYEEHKNIAKARAFYNVAIGMRGHEEENSIEGQAKQGLKRIGG